MPWFITSIISKETIARHPYYKSTRSRTFGFYEKYNEALTAVLENRCDMVECLYDYLVMEYIEEGIHPMVIHDFWFKWNDEQRKWVELEKRPEEYIGITNWGLG